MTNMHNSTASPLSGRRTFLILLALALVCAAGVYVFQWYRAYYQKVAAANVVKMADKHRNDRNTNSPLIDRTEGGPRWVVLGLPSEDTDFHRDWIILDATPGGEIMKRPDDGRFDLKCEYLQDLEKQFDIDPDVNVFLASRCHP